MNNVLAFRQKITGTRPKPQQWQCTNCESRLFTFDMQGAVTCAGCARYIANLKVEKR